MFFSVDKKNRPQKEYKRFFNRRNSSLAFGSRHPAYCGTAV